MKRTIAIFIAAALLQIIPVAAIGQTVRTSDSRARTGWRYKAKQQVQPKVSDTKYYISKEEMPDLVKCLPAPPDSASLDFERDQLRYLWGKRQRADKAVVARVTRDAIWDIDTLAAIFSVPFGVEISEARTPAIYRVFKKSVHTMGLIRKDPKAYYNRTRPFVYFDEHMLTTWEEDELRGEGSYPSGHTLRGWAAALILAQINPAAADALFLRGWEYGESRVIAGAHWQSDVDASRPAASIAFSRLQSIPEFRKDLADAIREFESLP